MGRLPSGRSFPSHRLARPLAGFNQGMTTREIMAYAGQSPLLMALLLGGPPLLAIVLGVLHRRGAGGRSPVKYGYSIAVYAACIPGMLALVVAGYMLFFTRQNLLDENVLVIAGPIASMVATLGIVGRQADFSELPGFGRLSGLMLMLAVTFASVVLVAKLNFVVLFHGSLWTLVALAVAIFIALKFGFHLAFRQK